MTTLTAEEIERLADELGQMVVEVALDKPAPQGMETGSEAWHAKRRQGIGGSDITTVLGLNPWSSPQALWRLKTGRDQPSPGNVYTQRGQTMESGLLAWYGQATGHTISAGKSGRHRAWPHIRLQGNADGQVDGSDVLANTGYMGDGLLEIKTTHQASTMAARYLGGCVPMAHLLQVHLYMDVLGYQWADILTAIGKDKHAETWALDDCRMVAFRILRNERILQSIAASADDFWACVESDRQPTWGRHRLASDVVMATVSTKITRLIDRRPP